MFSKSTNYRAYLLRLWKVPTKGDAKDGNRQTSEWRASLEAPHTREQLIFATLERLFVFLSDQTDQLPAEEQQRGKEE